MLARAPTEELENKNSVGPRFHVVSAINMGLGYSHDDLRARNAAPQPLRGGVISVTRRHALVATRGAAVC